MIYADSPSPILASVIFMVSATAMGYVIALLRLETGSIWPAIAFHAAYNSIIQSAFAPATTGAGVPLWVGMEAGILVALTSVVVGVIFSRGRWTIRKVPEVQQGKGAPSPAL
jgi:membrane protease YdiL (CAAX protease family)